MKTGLTVLYEDVVAGEVTTLEEFRQRLEAIDSLEQASSPTTTWVEPYGRSRR